MSKELVNAASIGDLKAVQELLQSGTDAAYNDNEALFAAIENDCYEVAEQLLTIDSVRQKLNKMLDEQIESGDYAITLELLRTERPELVKPILDRQREVLLSAVGDDALEVINQLLNYDEVVINIAGNKNEVLRKAIDFNNLKIVEKLLEIERVSVHVADDKNAILVHVLYDHDNDLEIVNILLSQQSIRESFDYSDPNGSFILELAIRHYPDVAKRLLNMPRARYKFNINEDSSNFLKLAIAQGSLDLINLLISRITDWSEIIKNKEDILIKAIQTKNLGVIELILKIPGIISDDANQNNKILLLAIKQGDLLTVSHLLGIEVFRTSLIASDGHLFFAEALNESARKNNFPMIYFLKNVFDSLKLELPLGLTIQGKSLDQFFKDYQEELDLAKQTLSDIFLPSRGDDLAQLIDDYSFTFSCGVQKPKKLPLQDDKKEAEEEEILLAMECSNLDQQELDRTPISDQLPVCSGESLKEKRARIKASFLDKVAANAAAAREATTPKPALLFSSTVTPNQTGLKTQVSHWKSRKELSEKEWTTVLSMVWEPASTTGNVQTTKMTSKEADAFKAKLAIAGIDVHDMRTGGNYITNEYYVEIPQAAQSILTTLHQESTSRKTPSAQMKSK